MTYINPHLIQSHASLMSAPQYTPQRQTNAADVSIAQISAGAGKQQNKMPSYQQNIPTSNSMPNGSNIRQNTSQSLDSGERYKITGSEETTRPDNESVWNSNTRQWMRKYLPGEYEAEVLERTLGVKEKYQGYSDERRHAFDMENTEQRSLLGIEQGIFGSRLKASTDPKTPAGVYNPNYNGFLKDSYNSAMSTAVEAMNYKKRGEVYSNNPSSSNGSVKITPSVQSKSDSSADNANRDLSAIYNGGGSVFAPDSAPNATDQIPQGEFGSCDSFYDLF